MTPKVEVRWRGVRRRQDGSGRLLGLIGLDGGEAGLGQANIDGHRQVVRKQSVEDLSLIHISEPTRPLYISYAVFCLKKKNQKKKRKENGK